MLINMKEIIPEISLPRSQGDKRIWLYPVKFEVEGLPEFYRVSFYSARGMGRRKFSEFLPKTIDIDDEFKMAIVAYMCEGVKPAKGAYTASSGNKGKNIGFSNSDLWLITLIIDQFQKIGIKREKWSVWLSLFEEHDDEKEKIWWSENLKVPYDNIKLKKKSLGNSKKIGYLSHGICSIEVYSVIYAAIIVNLINFLKQNNI